MFESRHSLIRRGRALPGRKRHRIPFRNSERNHGKAGVANGKFAEIAERILIEVFEKAQLCDSLLRGGCAFLDKESGRDKWMHCSIGAAIMPKQGAEAMKRSRRIHSSKFKAKVALEALGVWVAN